MNRYTRSLRSATLAVGCAFLLASCATGETEAPEEETPVTSSETISAEFPGGTAAVMSFLAGEVSYPESARADSVEGKVIVAFTIAENGEVTNAHVIDSLHPILDSAAVAAAMALPAWNPAKKDGKAISTTINLPITFKLN